MDNKKTVSFDDLDDPLATARPGGSAYQIYLDMLNVGRRTTTMTATTTTKTIDPSTPTRYAVVQVLTTGARLTSGEIIPLLRDFGYGTTTTKLRGSLNRLARKNLVEKIKRYERKHGASGWSLTADGATFAIAAGGHHVTNGRGNTHLAKGSGGTRKSSKGSSGRTSSMCNVDPSKPILNGAVRLTIAEFIQQKKAFSAYDITKALREKMLSTDPVQNTIVDPKETGTVYVQGKAVPKIEHEAVREVVLECFTANELTGYDRIHNGRYFEYKPALVPFTASVPDPNTPPDPATPATSGGSYDGTPTL
jgi:Fe2+ or Zn2+ uptake regulation protein